MISTPEGKDKLLAIGTILALMYVMYAITKPYFMKSTGSEKKGKVVYMNNSRR